MDFKGISICLFLLLLSARANAGFSHIQGTVGSAASSGTTASVTLASNPTSGNAVLCFSTYFKTSGSSTTLSSVKDGNNNNYTVSANAPSTYLSNVGQVFLFYLLNAPANANKTITVTYAATITYAQVWCDEFSATGPVFFDKDAKGTGTTGSTINTPSLTTSNPSELLFAGCQDETNVTAINSPWTNLGGGITSGNGGAYHLSITGTQAVNFSQDNASDWTCMIMAFFIGTGKRSGFRILD